MKDHQDRIGLNLEKIGFRFDNFMDECFQINSRNSVNHISTKSTSKMMDWKV